MTVPSLCKRGCVREVRADSAFEARLLAFRGKLLGQLEHVFAVYHAVYARVHARHLLGRVVEAGTLRPGTCLPVLPVATLTWTTLATHDTPWTALAHTSDQAQNSWLTSRKSKCTGRDSGLDESKYEKEFSETNSLQSHF